MKKTSLIVGFRQLVFAFYLTPALFELQIQFSDAIDAG
jgi:hypothetical protein